jgi:uncharacterized protein (TIGR03435 family)
VVAAAVLAASICTAQEKPKFDVASVKLETDCTGKPRGLATPPTPGRMSLQCSTVENLVRIAYWVFAAGTPAPNLKRIEVHGGPDWIRNDLYSIAAKPDGTARIAKMFGPMLQGLLEERFQLTLTTR